MWGGKDGCRIFGSSLLSVTGRVDRLRTEYSGAWGCGWDGLTVDRADVTRRGCQRLAYKFRGLAIDIADDVGARRCRSDGAF